MVEIPEEEVKKPDTVPQRWKYAWVKKLTSAELKWCLANASSPTRKALIEVETEFRRGGLVVKVEPKTGASLKPNRPLPDGEDSTIEDMLTEAWHGRDWHKMTVLEDKILSILEASGHMKTFNGFVYSTKVHGKEPK